MSVVDPLPKMSLIWMDQPLSLSLKIPLSPSLKISYLDLLCYCFKWYLKPSNIVCSLLIHIYFYLLLFLV